MIVESPRKPTPIDKREYLSFMGLFLWIMAGGLVFWVFLIVHFNVIGRIIAFFRLLKGLL